ncbi:ferrous iron transport protein B [Trueperella sp. LYQ141]|uniref:ferrous iron transport protein B n=1 Tax=Trueperella sp. LYQ141 TaxID=3391058 RepID=UPI0039838982
MTCSHCQGAGTCNQIIDGGQTVLLVGNPNVGKSTLFNGLTGARQGVCNAPGTTVEVFAGQWRDVGVRLIDTPGTYSLLPNSPDEEVVVDTVAGIAGSLTDPHISSGVGLAVAVLDATALSRSLYLVGQLAQAGVPLVCVLTMMDIATSSGVACDPVALQEELGVPVVSVDPRRRRGLDRLTRVVRQALIDRPRVVGIAADPKAPGYNAHLAPQSVQSQPTRVDITSVPYRKQPLRDGDCDTEALGNKDTAECNEALADMADAEAHAADVPAHTQALGNEEKRVHNAADARIPEDVLAGNTAGVRAHAATSVPAAPATPSASVLAGRQELSAQELAAEEAERAVALFEWIDALTARIGASEPATAKKSMSDRIDRILLNPVIGIGSFLLTMYVVFWLCNVFAAIFQDPFEQIFDSPDGWQLTLPAATFGNWPGEDWTLLSGPSLTQGVIALLTHFGLAGGVLEGILVGGLLTGMGVVASFAPLMIVMFIAIGMLEDSGYMARIAFLGDRVMRWIGLDGRVIMPFIVGFGCNLPTLAAMRTLPNSRHRIIAVILTPYLTCNARLVVYLLIANVFFPTHTTLIVWIMYVCSILMVILGGLVLKPIFLRGEQAAPLMLVLPPYQTPRALITLKTSAQRTWAFLKGAGQVIVVLTIVVWLLMHTPVVKGHSFGEDMPPSDSVYGTIAESVSPIFKPAGFDDWHLTGGLITGFIAKETMLGSLAATYQVGSEAACSDQMNELAQTYNPMSDEEIDADLAERIAAKDPLVAGYTTVPQARAAVDKAFTSLCVGVHLGTAEDDSQATRQMHEQLQATLKGTAGDASVVAAFAFLIFVLTYTPCLATVAEQWRQLGRKLTLCAVGAQLAVAWLLATLVFQIGRLFW